VIVGEKTPGRIAYEAWLATPAADPDLPPWETASQVDVDAWEEVAEAVRADLLAARDPRD
jgi:hypothetical protein